MLIACLLDITEKKKKVNCLLELLSFTLSVFVDWNCVECTCFVNKIAFIICHCLQ